MRFIDGDAHFIEPLDVFERYTDPAFRERTVCVREDDEGVKRMLVDGKPMQGINVDELLAAVCGYGQKEVGKDLSTFDRYLAYTGDWQDMGKRVTFLDDEGFDYQVIYPTLGLFWEGQVEDPNLADSLCRAYNSWAFELCAGRLDRLLPAAHISLRDPQLAVREMERVAKLGCRTIFLAAAPINGKSFGHPDFDPVWAAAQSLDLSIGIHLVIHGKYTGSEYYRHVDPGFMYVTMNIIQDPRQALTTMVYDGVFERFPKLRVATIEAMVGWVGEWLERLDYRFQYMGHTSQMKRPASEYLARNIWINGDPEEKMFPLMVQFLGDDRFFTGSDYPHAEGFVQPIQKIRNVLSSLPTASVDKILAIMAGSFTGSLPEDKEMTYACSIFWRLRLWRDSVHLFRRTTVYGQLPLPRLPTSDWHCVFAAVVVKESDFSLLSGEPGWYEKPADKGHIMRRAFCSACGSPVFLINGARTDFRALYAGSLDDPSWYQPSRDIYVASAQPWDIMHPDLPKVDGMPERLG